MNIKQIMQQLQMLAQNSQLYSSLLSRVQAGDEKGVEQIVRNIAKERGIDFDTEFNKFKQQYRR